MPFLRTAFCCFLKDRIIQDIKTSDSRCLYILNNKVFEEGTKRSPHKGPPCGMDVPSIIPSFHLADVAKYLDPNYKGTICTQLLPTATPRPPTATPTLRPTLTPTRIPTATLRP